MTNFTFDTRIYNFRLLSELKSHATVIRYKVSRKTDTPLRWTKTKFSSSASYRVLWHENHTSKIQPKITIGRPTVRVFIAVNILQSNTKTRIENSKMHPSSMWRYGGRGHHTHITMGTYFPFGLVSNYTHSTYRSLMNIAMCTGELFNRLIAIRVNTLFESKIESLRPSNCMLCMIEWWISSSLPTRRSPFVRFYTFVM